MLDPDIFAPIDGGCHCSGIAGSGLLSDLLWNVRPIDPSIKMCEICGMKPASGSVGSLTDPSFHQWVCELCYKYKLQMRPLAEIARDNEHKLSGSM